MSIIGESKADRDFENFFLRQGHVLKEAASKNEEEFQVRRRKFFDDEDDQDKTAAMSSGTPNGDFSDFSSQAKARSENFTSSQPVVGSDVGNLPGAPTGKMKISKAPDGGKKGSSKAATSARDMAERIKKSLTVKGKVEPEQKAVEEKKEEEEKPDHEKDLDEDEKEKEEKEKPEGKKKKPEKMEKGPDQVVMTPKRDNVSKLAGFIGIPPSLIGEDSVIWNGCLDKIAEVSQFNDADLSSYIDRPDVHPSALMMKLGSLYGEEWLEWELETIQQTLEEDIGKKPIVENMNKIAALKICIPYPPTDENKVYKDWHIFEKVALAFDGQAPRITLIEDLSPEQMAFAASCLRMIGGSGEYSEDMKKYCAARLFESGMIVAPPELGFCNEELRKLAARDPVSEFITKKAMELYVKVLQGEDADEEIDQENPKPELIQVGRLLRIHSYVLDKTDDLIRQTM